MNGIRSKWKWEQAERLDQWQREDRARDEQWNREDRRRWIDEQRTVYALSLKTARAFLDELQAVALRVELDHSDVDEIDKMVEEAQTTIDAAEQAFMAASADALIIASDSVMEGLTLLRRELRDAHWTVIYPRVFSIERMKTPLAEAESAYSTYFARVRQDLGIAEPPSPPAKTAEPD